MARTRRMSAVARGDRRPWTFYVLAALFTLYVAALYGPMICIYILSFQDIRGGLVFPMKGHSLHWFIDLFTQVRTGDVKGVVRSLDQLAVLVTVITRRGLVHGRPGVSPPLFRRQRRVLPDDRQPCRARPGARHRYRPDVPVARHQTELVHVGARRAIVLDAAVRRARDVRVMSPVQQRPGRRRREISAPRRWQTIRLVMIPVLAPGLVAVALFGFTLSYDEFARTLQTAGSLNTLPLEIWSMTLERDFAIAVRARHGDDDRSRSSSSRCLHRRHRCDQKRRAACADRSLRGVWNARERWRYRIGGHLQEL